MPMPSPVPEPPSLLPAQEGTLPLSSDPANCSVLTLPSHPSLPLLRHHYFPLPSPLHSTCIQGPGSRTDHSWGTL